MKMSDSIAELAAALAKAQGQIEAASKGSVNPHFKSKYADLNSLRDAIREPMAANDLAVVQLPRMSEKEVEVETMIIHKSGEYIAETLRMPVGQMTAQAVGSALTYCRRYSLSAVLNLSADDDDGNAASERPMKPVIMKASPNLLEDGREAAEKSKEALREWYKGLSSADRQSLDADDIKTLQKIAETVSVEEG